MANYFENIEPGRAAELEQLSQLIYELRENRNSVLMAHDAEDEAALLQRIQTGAVAEHPAYEHYLAARVLADTLDAVRATVTELLKETNKK